MKLFKSLLAAGGAAGIVIGLAVATPVLATVPFTGTVLLQCATVGQTQKVTINSSANVLIHIEVTINNSTANGGTQNGTGLTDAQGTFTDSWTIASQTATTAVVRVWALTSEGVATGETSFLIKLVNQTCPTPTSGAFTGTLVDTTQVSGQVKKTCDTGVSGNAVFSATLTINVSYSTTLSTTFQLPAGLTLTLPCNGAAKALPSLPVTSVIKLHESTAPSGAAAAADTTITLEASAATTTTIHNAKAAVSATPTPTAAVLPATGQPASTPTMPWPAVAVLGLIAVAGAGLVFRRKS